jgi:hypothetical protein
LNWINLPLDKFFGGCKASPVTKVQFVALKPNCLLCSSSWDIPWWERWLKCIVDTIDEKPFILRNKNSRDILNYAAPLGIAKMRIPVQRLQTQRNCELIILALYVE